MTRTSLEKHPGTDRLPYGLRPGGEGGRRWLEVPGVSLGHDRTESRAEMDRAPVALTSTPSLAGVVTARLTHPHQVDETKMRQLM